MMVYLKPSRYFSAGVWLPEVRRLPDSENRVALSFDDGPAPETTAKILELLTVHHATATFFLNGVRAAEHPHLVQAIVHAGHDVYSHGWNHVHYDKLGPDQLIQDLDRCEAYLGRFRPTPSPYLVRLPYTAGHRCAWAHRALRSWNSNVQLVHYSVTLNDWSLHEDCETYGDVVKKAQRTLARLRVDKLPGRIILLHEMAFDAPGPQNATVGPVLLREMLRLFSIRGLRAVKVIPLSRQSIISRYFLGPRSKIVVTA